MTDRIEQVIARLRGLPESRQNEIAELLDEIVDDDQNSWRLTAEQIDVIRLRMANPRRTVTNDEVKRFFDRKT